MSRALRFEQFGPPAEALKLVDVPQANPGPGQVRLRLSHRAINPSDLYTVSGHYGRLPTLPAVPGFEAVGRIAALGEGVTGWQIGQRAIPLSSGGTWQEEVLVNVAQLLPVAEGVPDQSAAQFVVNPVTAWVMMTDELNLQPGQWLLQTAAGSTLGRTLIQMAQLQGVKTINFVRRREQVQELLDLGADAVICTEDADVVAQVLALTEGRGVHGGVDAVGGQTGALAASCLRAGATLLVYGGLSGQALPLNGGEMIFKGTTVRGFWLTFWFGARPQPHVQAVLTKLMTLMAQGKIVPPVEAEYDLADFRQAVLHAETPGRAGKVLLIG